MAVPPRSRVHRTGQARTRARLFLHVELLESRDLLSGIQPTYVLLTKAGRGPLASGGPTGIFPSQIRNFYGFNQLSFDNGNVLADGTGITIALVDAYNDPNVSSDLDAFDNAFGPLSTGPTLYQQYGPASSFLKVVNQSGGTSLPTNNSSWSEEIALDVEWAHAIAPGAKILLVEAKNSGGNNLYAAASYAATQASVISMSWGGGEFSTETSYDTTYFGRSGVTFIASSGDDGAPPIYPSISPDVLSVGGTTLTLDNSNPPNILGDTTGWSGSGGGISDVEAQPNYQNNLVIHNGPGGGTISAGGMRSNPDVAYDADPNTGFPEYNSYSFPSAPWQQFGGTSDAAPQWAGLIAIADQGRALDGLGTLNGRTQTLPMLYALPASDFNDITTGTSTGSPNYTAAPGYDLVSGRGTPQANKIVSALVDVSFTVVAPTNANPGNAFSVTVQALDQFNNPATSYKGTIHFSSTDNNAVLPPDAVLTGGSGVFSVTLETAGGQTLTVTDAASGSNTGTSSAIAVGSTVVAQFGITAPLTSQVGSAFSVTVSALDQFNNLAMGYSGTVHFTSSDPAALLPADTTLVNGVGIFSVTFQTLGNQTVTATDTVNQNITGASNNIVVGLPAATHFSISGPTNTTVGSVFGFTVTALTANNNPATAYAGTVTFSSSDAGATFMPAVSTLSGGAGVFSVALTTAGSQTLMATDTQANTLTGTSNAVVVSPEAATHFGITATGTATAGSSIGFTVAALDPFNNTAVGYAGTVAFSSGDSAASFAPLAGTLSGGVGIFGVTLKTAGNQTIVATDIQASTLKGTSGPIAVGAGAAARLMVNAAAAATAGTPFSFTVTALDAFNNLAAGYAGSVAFSSADSAAGFIPQASTLAGGQGIFSVTLKTAGIQTVAATDTQVSSLTGVSTTVLVSPAATSHFGVSAQATATAGTPVTFTVTALDSFNNVATGYGGTVAISSSDSTAGFVPSANILSAGVGIFSVTLKTAGNQIVAATDTQTTILTGTSAPLAVNAGAATHFAVVAPALTTLGSAIGLTVTAEDAFNNTATGYSGIVYFSSSDSSASLPGNSQLTGGVGVFSAILNTPGPQSITAIDTVAGTISGSTFVTVNRPPATHFLVSAASGGLTAGSSLILTVTALDRFNNTAVNYTGTVSFTSSDSAAVLPSAATLANGAGTFSATLVTAGTQTLKVSDAASITGSIAVSVTPAVANSFSISAPTLAVTGKAFTFTVTAKDQYGNIATSYAGIVHFSGSDSKARLPANSTLVSGMGTFSATLVTVGAQSLTAADTTTSAINGSATITVPVTLSIPTNLSGGQGNTVTVPINVNALNDPASPFHQSGLSGADFVLYYNPSAFSVTDADVHLGTISTPTASDPIGTGQGDGFSPSSPNGWSVTPDTTTPGYLNIVLTNNNLNGLVTGTGGGSLATVTFHILAAAPVGPSIINLAADSGGPGSQPSTYLADSVDDLQSFLAYSLYPAPQDDTILQPAYATSGSDPINGIVSVSPGATHFLVSSPSTVQAGHFATFTVTALDQFNQVAANYAGTVQFTSSDGRAVLPDPSTLTNGASVFFAIFETVGNQTIRATDSANNALSVVGNSVTVTPGAIDHFTVAAPPSAVAGAPFAITVTAQDQYGNTASGYSGTVVLTSSDGQALLAANSTLAGGVGTFGAILATAGNQTLVATDSLASGIAGTATVHVSAASATHFVVTAPAGTTAGHAAFFTVTAEDPFNNAATTYTGTIAFTSSDSRASLPATGTLTGGSGFFAVVLKTAGSQTVAATDKVRSSIAGSSRGIAVSAAAAASFALAPVLPVYTGVTAGPTSFATTGIPLTFSVAALDPFANVAPTYTGTVHFTSSDSAASLPANAILTNGAGTFSAVLETPGNQSLSATDAGNAITGTSSPFAARGLVVTSFTPTSSGFTIAFNKPFNGNLVNLYTSGSLPDDVTLTTAGSQVSVRGSLVMNSLGTGFTFIKTDVVSSTGSFNPGSGLLAAGTYTLTLRSSSATSGFQDALGSPLDGSNSGSPGANFQLTFAVNTPPVAIGIPDFARSPSNTDAIYFSPTLTDGSTFALGYTNPAATPATGTATVTFSTSAAVLQSNIQNALSNGGLAVQIGETPPGLTGVPNAVVVVTNDVSSGANVLVTFQSTLAQAANQLLTSSTPGVAIAAATINAANNIPGSGIPIALTSGLGATSGLFTLQYNPALLNITGVVPSGVLSALGASFTLVSNNTTTGTAVLSLSSPTRISSTTSALTLGSLLATVPLSATSSYGAVQLLHFSSEQLSGTAGAIPIVNQDGLQVAAYFGDVTGAGGPLTLQDAEAIATAASQVPNTLAQTLPGFSAFPNLDPVIIGDVSLQGSVNSTDAGAMAQLVGGNTRPTIPVAPIGLTVAPLGINSALASPAAASPLAAGASSERPPSLPVSTVGSGLPYAAVDQVFEDLTQPEDHLQLLGAGLPEDDLANLSQTGERGLLASTIDLDAFFAREGRWENATRRGGAGRVR